MSRSSIRISPTIALNLSNRGLRYYSVWLYMKYQYRNSCYYNYSINAMAKALSVSRCFIRKYVSKFLQLGWCRLHGGNLVFVKHEQMPERKEGRCKLQLIKHGLKQFTVDGILSMLQSFVIKDAQRKQLFAKVGKDVFKRLIQNETVLPMAFTVYKASSLFSISIASASRLLRKLAADGWFHREEQHFKAEFTDPDYVNQTRMVSSPDNPFKDYFTYISFKGKMFRAYPCRLWWYSGLEAYN